MLHRNVPETSRRRQSPEIVLLDSLMMKVLVIICGAVSLLM